MKHLIFSSAIVIILILINPGFTYSNNQPARFSSGLGIHNLMQNGETRCTKPQSDQTCFTSDLKDIDSSSFAFNLEYYTKRKLLRYLQPSFGYLGTQENAHFGYFGLSMDFFFAKCKCLVISPSLAAGWYVDGNDIKMGNRVQFKSGGDFSYKFRNNVRISIGLYHLSNAGLGDKNPGSETAVFKYQIPFN